MAVVTPSSHLRNGYTLVEIMIVVVIVGLLASLAIPAFLRIQENSLATRIANDFRIFRGGFETYLMEHGSWPADVNQGVLPPEMEGYFTSFTEPFPNGDLWDWDRNAAGAVAGISLQGGNTPERIMERVDKTLDDGNLSTGSFTRNGDRYTLELE